MGFWDRTTENGQPIQARGVQLNPGFNEETGKVRKTRSTSGFWDKINVPDSYDVKQRDDKGFDFYKNGKLIKVDEYVKAQNIDKDKLVYQMAQAGDEVSRNILLKEQLASDRTIRTFNKLSVYQQRTLLDNLEKQATATDVTTPEKARSVRAAQDALGKLQLALEGGQAQQKGGNPLTFAQDYGKSWAQSYQNVGGAVAGGVFGADQATVDTQERWLKEVQDSETIVSGLKRRINQEKDPAKKKTLQSQLAKQEGFLELARVNSENLLNEVNYRGDPARIAGSFGTVGLDVITGGAISGVAKAATRGGASKFAENVAQKVLTPKGIGQGAASGGLLGAGYGVAGTAEQLGTDATAADYLTSAGMGAGIGVALGGGIPLAGRAFKGVSGAGARAGAKDISAAGATPVRKSPLAKVDEFVSSGIKSGFKKLEGTTAGQKIDAFMVATQSKFQNSTAPIYRQLNELQRSGKLTENEVKNIKGLIQTSRFSSRTLAREWMNKNAASAAALAPVNGKTLGGKTQERLAEYINARTELNLMALDKKRGVKISPEREANFKKVVAELDTPEAQARYDALVQANADLTDLLVENGIVSAKQRDAWRKTNSEYIRVQRVLDDISEMRGKGTGGKVSRGSTIASQKRKGSTKEATDPFETLTDRSNRVWQEITSQHAANAYIEALKKSGAIGEQLRDAEKVVARQELRDALRFSRPLKNQLERFEKSQLKYVRRIQNELDKLNRAGLDAALSKPLPDPNLAGKLVDPGAKMTKAELKSVLENIVQNTDTRILKAIRKKIAKREPKLATALSELEDIQSVLDGVNAQRYKQYQEAAQLTDKKTHGRPTIQRFVDGVKESYVTTPEIEKAAKGMGPVYMGAVGRAISAPVRFLQTTITGGLNPSWAATAIPRDFIEGLVISGRAAQTHSPANILNSVLEASGIKRGSERALWDKFIAYERGSSSVIDLTRGAKSNARALRELSRQQLPKLKRGASIIKNPKDWYETIQEAAKWNEQWTKYQHFRGHYNRLIDQGVDPEQATSIALYEARQGTGNLMEQGDWTKALAAVYPYFNPTVQGGTSLLRALRDKPVSTSGKIIMAVQIPAAIATAWNMSDPRRAEIYLDISESERERFNIIVLPGSEKTDGAWQVVKIPKAPGVGMFANPVERFMVQLYGEDPGQFEDVYQSIIKGFGSPIDPSSLSSAIGSVVPFQIKPGVEAVTNHKFYNDKEIVPSWLKEANPDEPYKQAFDETSSTFKLIGKALGISPLQVENFTNSTTGEFGRNTLWLSDVALDLAGIGEGGVGGRNPLRSVTKNFYGAYGGERTQEAKAELNDIFNQKTSTSSRVTDAIASSNYDEASKIAREFNDKISALQAYIEKNKSTVELTEKQLDALEKQKFPMEGDSLSMSSIKSRLRNLSK